MPMQGAFAEEMEEHGVLGRQMLHEVVEIDPSRRPSALPCSAVPARCVPSTSTGCYKAGSAITSENQVPRTPKKHWIQLTRYVHFGHLNVRGPLILTPGPKGIVTHRQNTERKKEDDAGRKEVLLVACLPQKRSRLGISANVSELPRRPKIVSSLGIHVEAEMQKWSQSH
jgi:hypothetical protein